MTAEAAGPVELAFMYRDRAEMERRLDGVAEESGR
jgi:hypothetical protein